MIFNPGTPYESPRRAQGCATINLKDCLFFVDKTRFIPLLEQNRYVFFIRPRRFGKSLWVSILETYYDVAKKDRFETFFHNTWIGEHPTEERNRYLILKFNFSAVEANTGYVEQSFEEYGHGVLNSFLRKYGSHFPPSLLREIEMVSRFAPRLNYLLKACRDAELSIYLLIDEYDNFANTILTTAGNQAYQDFLIIPVSFQYS